MMRKDSTGYSAARPAWDKQDCSVRALASAAGVSYETASAAFSARGRRLGRGTEVELSRRLYEDVLGMKRVTLAEGMLLGDFADLARTGSFIIHSRTHAFALVEGVVHDWEARTSHPRTKIEAAWKVTDLARGKMRKMEGLMKELGA